MFLWPSLTHAKATISDRNAALDQALVEIEILKQRLASVEQDACTSQKHIVELNQGSTSTIIVPYRIH